MTEQEKLFYETQIEMLYLLDEIEADRQELQSEIDALQFRPLTRPEARVQHD